MLVLVCQRAEGKLELLEFHMSSPRLIHTTLQAGCVSAFRSYELTSPLRQWLINYCQLIDWFLQNALHAVIQVSTFVVLLE